MTVQQFIHANELDRSAPTMAAVTMYAREKLGCELPVGAKQRAAWYKRAKNEMAIQGWTLDDLVRAIDYCNAQGLAIRRIDGILYFVEKGRKSKDEFGDLQMKVAEALGKETDSDWVRRLSLAQGKALEKVYRLWLMQRGANAV